MRETRLADGCKHGLHACEECGCRTCGNLDNRYGCKTKKRCGAVRHDAPGVGAWSPGEPLVSAFDALKAENARLQKALDGCSVLSARIEAMTIARVVEWLRWRIDKQGADIGESRTILTKDHARWEAMAIRDAIERGEWKP